MLVSCCGSEILGRDTQQRFWSLLLLETFEHGGMVARRLGGLEEDDEERSEGHGLEEDEERSEGLGLEEEENNNRNIKEETRSRDSGVCCC